MDACEAAETRRRWRSGQVRSGVNLRIGLLSSISRADSAVSLLDEIERPRYVRRAVFVKG